MWGFLMREHRIAARVVCHALNVESRHVLRSRCRASKVVRARWVTVLILYRWGMTVDDIADGFAAYRDHTGVLWAVRRAVADPVLHGYARILYPEISARLESVSV